MSDYKLAVLPLEPFVRENIGDLSSRPFNDTQYLQKVTKLQASLKNLLCWKVKITRTVLCSSLFPFNGNYIWLG